MELVVIPLGVGVLASLVWYVLLRSGSLAGRARERRRAWRDIGRRARRAGVTRFIFSRSDYKQRLPDYLALADWSIRIVSVSLHATSQEGQLIDLFRRKLTSRHDFEVQISLLNPRCRALEAAARSLAMTPDGLAVEIRSMLKALADLKRSLPVHVGGRLEILVHDALPAGSVILLDGQPESGRLQVETKLYGAPRTESFGYEVCGPGEFYRRNYDATMRILRESRTPTAREIE